MRILAFALLFCAATASAQSSPPSFLSKGTWDLAVQTGGGTTWLWKTSTTVPFWTAGMHIGRVLTNDRGRGWLRGNLEFGVEVLPVFLTWENGLVYGGGLNPVSIRWNFTPKKHLVPFYDLTLGMLFTQANVPTGDTSRFNFTAQMGGGAYVFRREKSALAVAAKFIHISSANLGNFNPGINGVNFVVEYHWFR